MKGNNVVSYIHTYIHIQNTTTPILLPIKSAATDTVKNLLKDRAMKFTSLTLAGLKHLTAEFTDFSGHIIIDDMGTEKSDWSRTSTITVLATLVHTHYVKKVTNMMIMELTGFYGSASLNIQPILLQNLIGSTDWIAVVRDKVLRYYHMVRPTTPKNYLPPFEFTWGLPIEEVKKCKQKGKLWYQLVAIGLTQWSYARCLEHIPELLRALAALDMRTTVKKSDYTLLLKLLQPMQVERYLVEAWGFESGRVFDNNTFCVLVEIVSHLQPSIRMLCEDYKVSPETVERITSEMTKWVWLKKGEPTRIMPTEYTAKILDTCGVNTKW
uniref:Uncharacterized protein n=1 Tax=viral metagenome TaxID=1070528 RepID=A0A6H1ZMS7_9ZZZZ